MAKSITYKTKIVGLSKIVLQGELGYFDESAFLKWFDSGWGVQDSSGHIESISEWLEKFNGQYITITIDAGRHDDDEHLLRNAQEDQI